MNTLTTELLRGEYYVEKNRVFKSLKAHVDAYMNERVSRIKASS